MSHKERLKALHNTNFEEEVGFIEERFPIADPYTVKEASHWFQLHHTEVPPSYRRPLAQHIEKCASAFGVEELSEAVGYYTGGGSREGLLDELAARAYAKPESKNEYQTLATMNIPMEKMATVLAELDMATGNNELWDKHLKDPWRVIFDKGMEKKADCFKEYKMFSEIITGGDIERLATDHSKAVERYLGVVRSSDFLRDPIEYFEKAPSSLQRVIVMMAKQAREEAR